MPADYGEIVKMCGILSAYYPHAPQMNQGHFKAYHMMLEDLDPEILRAAMVECVSDSPDFIPPAPKIRSKAFELIAIAEGRPTAEDAWAEVTRSFSSHGIYRGAPDWSHELIGKTVESMGGYNLLCRSDNPVADRAHFARIYNALLNRQEQYDKMLPASREVVLKLADSLRPALTSGDENDETKGIR